MSILVIGGDKLGNIKGNLKMCGFEKIEHITGRKKGDLRFEIPLNTDMVLVLTDYVSHQLTEVIKKKSKKCNAKFLFAKRSWTHIQNHLDGII